jgi:polyhydroxyalkanoate synthesis regulator phasin
MLEMVDEIKSGMFKAMGAALLTKDKIEETVKKLVDESKLKEDEARRLVEELAKAGEKQAEKLEADIQALFDKTAKDKSIVQREDFDSLQQRVDGMEARISLLENKNIPTPGTPGSRPVS